MCLRSIKSSCTHAIAPGKTLSTAREINYERGTGNGGLDNIQSGIKGSMTRTSTTFFNPVQHGWVPHVVDWPPSRFYRFVRLGLNPLEWAASLEIPVWELEQRSTSRKAGYAIKLLTRRTGVPGSEFPITPLASRPDGRARGRSWPRLLRRLASWHSRSLGVMLSAVTQ
jgi:hypothetical protein